jgi:predicted DNA-binding transcriptional regulator AlpA
MPVSMKDRSSKTRTKATTPAEALADISLKDDRLVGTAEAAQLLGLAPKTLREWRSKRTGPAALKLGTGPKARVVYRLSALERWVRENSQAWAPSPVAVIGGKS